ncbi:hypothetical protein B0H14DRAFT_2615978 [Mycena olivaceomarginata]|nr:hypothetical protein B0H14DRAFT_2615978 [Mycena olivaceomarginata]
MSQWVSDIMRRQQAREQALAGRSCHEYGHKVGSHLTFKGGFGNARVTKAWNDLTRKLAHITRAKLNLRPNIPTPFSRIYGYLDIASPAEALQNAKDSLREAAMSSLDGSMKVYPVQLSPIDWFESLSTSFTMEDLTQDPEVIPMQIDAKSQQLDILNSQLVSLQMGTKDDATDLQNNVAAAQTALDSAQSTLSQAYPSNTGNRRGPLRNRLNGSESLWRIPASTRWGRSTRPHWRVKSASPQSVSAQLPAMMDAVQKAQDKLTSSSRALSALALAEATDTKQQQQQLALQIQSLTGELKELQTRWQILTCTTGGVATGGSRSDWLRPFEHYIPVLPDLSDLVQKIEWANENPEEAWLIQQRGLEVAQRVTTDDQNDCYLYAAVVEWTQLLDYAKGSPG